jgi:RNA polymerase sigma-70 factor, ECF subfamily
MDATTPDPVLIAAAVAGDAHAFRLLVDRYEGLVAGTVVGMLGPGDDADDVGQETFIRLYRSLDRFRGESALSHYLHRIAVNLSLNALKRRKRLSMRLISRDRAPGSVPEPRTDPGAGDAWQKREHVQAAISGLAPHHRAVVVLRMLEGCSTRETAEILELPEGTVMSRLSRAMKELARDLSQYEPEHLWREDRR